MNKGRHISRGGRVRRRLWPLAGAALVLSGAASIYGIAAEPGAAPAGGTSLDETRLALSKWIETQQIITKERKEWQQGKEILASRIELVQKEIADTQEQIRKSEAVVEEAHKKRDELQKDNDALKDLQKKLADAATEMEGEVQRLYKQLPEPVQKKIEPLYSRIPKDPATTKVATAERFQNIVGILNAVNTANGEIAVNYEVRDAAEVKAVYVGLAQAYYVSAKGDAGVGHPTADGWEWETDKKISDDVLKTLEIIQGKETASFVPLPMKMQ